MLYRVFGRNKKKKRKKLKVDSGKYVCPQRTEKRNLPISYTSRRWRKKFQELERILSYDKITGYDIHYLACSYALSILLFNFVNFLPACMRACVCVCVCVCLCSVSIYLWVRGSFQEARLFLDFLASRIDTGDSSQDESRTRSFCARLYLEMDFTWWRSYLGGRESCIFSV